MEVDHIKPVVDPKKGFTTWDDFIDRLFCEKKNLQALCRGCHAKKTKEERGIKMHAMSEAKASTGNVSRQKKKVGD